MLLNREKLKQKFLEEYKRLNDEQQRAVDAIEGPVMVIAGPGTGKTQILASRIGKILLHTDAFPENILCLTYTDAGVIAMRRRLLQLIGTDAYKVNIATFHAFCNDVIQENLSLFEKTAMDPVSEIERTALFKKLIDGFEKNNPLKRYRGDVYFEINNLNALFSAMKRENWPPQFIHEKIDEYIAGLPQRDEYIAKRATKDFKKGDVRTDKIAEETEKMEKLRAAVNQFPKFQQLMRSASRYDFDDMITWVIGVFEEGVKNPGTPQAALLSACQEKFQYILVDEYQDTSGTQNRITELLTAFWPSPNIFVVGDDDQSIYRFQGASVENMLDFATRHRENLATVVLTKNYRSTQPVLDVAMNLINRNNERLVNQVEGLSKKLETANPLYQGISEQPVIDEYETPEQEMAGITLEIERLIALGTEPAAMAVIYRENRYGTELARYFKAKNIPYYTKRSINILEQPIVRRILLVMNYLAAEHDIPFGGGEMLFEILHFDWFNVPAIDIAKLSAEAAATYGENKISFRQLLEAKAKEPPKDLFSKGMNENLANAIGILEKLIGKVPNLTLQQLFEEILGRSGALAAIMVSPEKNRLMQYVTRLFDFVKEETARNPSLTLQQFVDLVELMKKEGLPLTLNETSGSDKGVNLLTAHGSKGLEFDYVFLAGSNAGAWEKKRKPSGGYSLPDNMFSSTKGAGELEELRRLFYVAITRAKQHLHISYSRLKADGRETEASLFVAEIMEDAAIQPQPIAVTREQLTEFGAGFFTEGVAPEIQKAEAEFIDRMLEKFAMNVTALNHYLNCPLEFYFKNIAKIPTGKSEAAEFGSAVHYALQRLFERMQKDEAQAFPSLEIFVEDFDWYMKRHRENFTREQFNRRMEYGREILSNYYNKYISNFNKIVAVERNIRNIIVNGVPLKGKMDKLEFDGKNVNVVDYKTGDIEKARLRLKAPSEKDPVGGDYWRQAVFYKLLIDQYEQRGWKVLSTEFDFIEPDRKKNFQREKVVITPDDTEMLTQQITEVWQKIQQRDFYTGCGKEDCRWCNFAKDYKMVITGDDADEEEND